jgi:hypothetical protein
MMTRVYFNGIYDNDTTYLQKEVVINGGAVTAELNITPCPYGREQSIVELDTGIYRLSYSSTYDVAYVHKLVPTTGTYDWMWEIVGASLVSPGFLVDYDNFMYINMYLACNATDMYLCIEGNFTDVDTNVRPCIIVYKLVESAWVVWCELPSGFSLGYTYYGNSRTQIFVMTNGNLYVQSRKLLVVEGPSYDYSGDYTLLEISEDTADVIYTIVETGGES